MLAALVLALGTAATALADESGFISSVSLDYYAIECPGCTQDALEVGYRVCAAFDNRGTAAAVAEVLRSYNGPGQSNQAYWATQFAGYPADQLCPKHSGEIGPI